MKFTVVIAPQASEDINRNSDWWAEHHSWEEALRWADAVYDQIATLTEFPESHGLSAENDEFSYEIRDKLVGLGSKNTYRAVFTIKVDTIYVLTV